ncbi:MULTISPECIES: hypothetical protein [unclassified Mycobacterium]|uniref:hypothetical protein n=1 Tax=unclassified Mycobacterium TaxID=2642494 RepID=UPI0029C983E1|nr:MULTISPECIES: hypothetical protein [unclassified Mycobacterium]
MESEDVTAAREDESPKIADPGRPRTLDVNGFREQRDQIAAEARRRYQVHLATAFGTRGYSNADTLANLALDALTGWRYADTGADCRCGCHPQLPTSDWHGYGFDCFCTKTRDERKRLLDGLRRDSDAFWQSLEGQEITAAKRVEEADLQEWLALQPDVTADSDGGFAPEAWNGEVAGHRFYFRERGGQWRIELDLRPTGRFVPEVVAVAASGEPRIEHRETEEGDVIAHGDTADGGYGTTPRERVQFIVGKIREHLLRASCTLHTGNLSAVENALGQKVRWCPACGNPLGG